MRRRIGIAAVVLAFAVAGCDDIGGRPLAPKTFEPGIEHGPGPASIWLTTDPAVPVAPVLVVMTSLDEAGVHFSHTFRVGAPARGSFATSEGRYRLAALGGACDRCGVATVVGDRDRLDH